MPRPKAFDEEAVLQKAVNLFWCRGYEATSVQDLVDGLGINRASLYDTYGDKRELYIKALEHYRDAEHNGFCQWMDQSRPAIDLLRDLFTGGIRQSVDDPQQKGCFLVNATIELAPHDPAIARIVAANQRTFEERLRQVIERGQREGSINRAHSAADLARFLFTTFTGLKVMSRARPDLSAMQAVMDVAMSTLQPID
ncbi:TetR/AcrR family transcriptional regulator [Fibrisoma montanum]|uniref:TetR/AcrR family transcriptional regulator n=1 Tax=Fibrisoma montanum TaxID=2305895 RepID=A0A418MDU3_9BACT|nr:TetR/AcrR family transcriptional regulator [Fibrisoma montanum]RIV24951.1 TetR/AcrR family transcriptional regulator [Fibrisoma montanum]